jgi:hypothetical protein
MYSNIKYTKKLESLPGRNADHQHAGVDHGKGAGQEGDSGGVSGGVFS